MLYLLAGFYLLALALAIYACIKMAQNTQLKNHRKAFWVFVFLTIPYMGLFLYYSSQEYKKFQYRRHK